VSAERERSSEAGGRAIPSDRGTGGPAEQPRVGVDLLEIDRLERALGRRPRLAERLFTDPERLYAASRARPGQHLAARFCAKEAVAKALGLEAWSFRDVEVLPADGGGRPEVRLSGSAAARAAALGVRVSVSLTHTREQAAAVAVASPQA
jgi:holo-[acyl-carrier protein] synthase